MSVKLRLDDLHEWRVVCPYFMRFVNKSRYFCLRSSAILVDGLGIKINCRINQWKQIHNKAI